MIFAAGLPPLPVRAQTPILTELLCLLIEDPTLIARSAICVPRNEGVVFVPALDPSHVVDPEEAGLYFFAFVVLDHDSLLALVELGL